jgi:hypothetical protein
MGKNVTIFIRIPKAIKEFIDNSLVNQEINGVEVHRKSTEIYKDIFMEGWKNYHYKWDDKEEK